MMATQGELNSFTIEKAAFPSNMLLTGKLHHCQTHPRTSCSSSCPERQPLGQAPSPPAASARWTGPRVPNVNRSGKLHHGQRDAIANIGIAMSRTSTARASSITDHARSARHQSWRPERQPLGQAPSHAARCGSWHAPDSPERQPLGQAPSPAVSRVASSSRGLSRTSTARASSITHEAHQAPRIRREVPNVNRSGKLHHAVPRRRSARGFSVPNVNRSGKLHHGDADKIAAYERRSRTSTARASSITRALVVRRIRHTCPERQPLGQAPSRGHRERHAAVVELVPNVNRSGKLHHRSSFPSLRVSRRGPERQPLGQAPSRESRPSARFPRVGPERQPLGQAPSRTTRASGNAARFGPERQPLGQAPSPRSRSY